MTYTLTLTKRQIVAVARLCSDQRVHALKDRIADEGTLFEIQDVILTAMSVRSCTADEGVACTNGYDLKPCDDQTRTSSPNTTPEAS